MQLADTPYMCCQYAHHILQHAQFSHASTTELEELPGATVPEYYGDFSCTGNMQKIRMRAVKQRYNGL
jgi:hypothetical protein